MHKIGKLSVCFVLLFSAFFANTAKATKDELTIGITQFPSSFHPTIDSMMAKSYILGMTRRPFTAYDHNWKLICLLCTKLPTIENGLAVPEKTPKGKQGIAITYSIHPKATWGDGKAVTTEDVKFTWEVGRHKKSGVGNMELYRSLYKIDVKNDKTFTLHFDKLTYEYNAINDFDLLPAHLDRVKFEAGAQEYRNRTTFDTDTTNEGLYFGPYLIDKVVRGSHVILVQNPKWWGKKPSFKRIVVKVVENTAALEANLLSGSIDMIAGELGLSLDQAVALEKRHSKRFDISYKAGLIYEHMDVNLDNPILADKRVRKALILGLNRQAISDRLFAGRQPVAQTMVSPLDWVIAKDLPSYSYDPQTALKLLNEAGWKKVRKGIRHNSKGEPLRIELMTTAGNKSRELVEQVIQSQLKNIGFDIRIKNQPARVFFGETVTERKYSGLAMYAWISSPENAPRTTLHSAYIPNRGNNFSGQNYPGFVNEEMDQLVDDIEIELNREKRKKLWRRVQEIYLEELPVIPLYFRANPFILPKWLKGVKPTGHQGPTTLWVENWHRNK